MKMKQYICPCGKEFQTGSSLQHHEQHCSVFKRVKSQKQEQFLSDREARRLPNGMFKCENPKCQKEHDGSYGSGRFCSKRCKLVYIGLHVIGPVGCPSPFKGHHHTKETRQKLRLLACERLMKCSPNHCNYNRSSIPILEKIAAEHGWTIQHAENGGEFYTGIGYWVDAYDAKNNVVLEYDEPIHYVDPENNVLTPKDIERQQEIIEHLCCEYWRYNEKTKTLWKAN